MQKRTECTRNHGEQSGEMLMIMATPGPELLRQKKMVNHADIGYLPPACNSHGILMNAYGQEAERYGTI